MEVLCPFPHTLAYAFLPSGSSWFVSFLVICNLVSNLFSRVMLAVLEKYQTQRGGGGNLWFITCRQKHSWPPGLAIGIWCGGHPVGLSPSLPSPSAWLTTRPLPASPQSSTKDPIPGYQYAQSLIPWCVEQMTAEFLACISRPSYSDQKLPNVLLCFVFCLWSINCWF